MIAVVLKETWSIVKDPERTWLSHANNIGLMTKDEMYPVVYLEDVGDHDFLQLPVRYSF